LIAQPAERISTVPTVKITSSGQDGCPSDAIHSALSVGHSSSRLPIGLSMRTSRKYRGSRANMGGFVKCEDGAAILRDAGGAQLPHGRDATARGEKASANHESIPRSNKKSRSEERPW
jgi:hypothetical protein